LVNISRELYDDLIPQGWPLGSSTVISWSTVSTAPWYDLTQAAVTDGAVNLYSLEVVIKEL
jgi:hypothetical protein